MRVSKLHFRSITSALVSVCVGAVVLSGSAHAAEVKEPLYGQVLLGQLNLDDNTVTIDLNEEVYEGDLPDSLPYLGVAAQVPWKDDVIGYGWEGGGFISWKNQNIAYSGTAGGGGAVINIQVDNNYWSFETFMGLYASFKPVNGFRLYAGAGPLFLMAVSKVDNVNPQPQPLTNTSGGGSTIYINVDDYHSDFTLGAYARAGFDVHIHEQYWIGFSVRHMQAEIDLDKSIGTFDIDGDIYYFSMMMKY